eukprot:Gb_05222 [translate_table: standard]
MYSHQAHGKHKESRPDFENEIRKDASLRNTGFHESKDRNPAHKSESSDKVIEDTALLPEVENYQPKARPWRESPNLTCESKILSNITHELVKVANPRDSKGIPQASTEESPQGTKKMEFVINNLAKVSLQKETTNHPVAQQRRKHSLRTSRSHQMLLITRIPNFRGQACPGFNNTNIFQNSNSMGGTNAFSQGPAYPNNESIPKTIIGGVANLRRPIGGAIQPKAIIMEGTIDTEYGFVKKEDDAASTRDSSESTASLHSKSTYHCERASDPHEPTLEDKTNINSDVDSEEFITNCLHEADELNHYSCFHLERLPNIDEEEEMGYYEEDSDEEDVDDEEEIELEVIQPYRLYKLYNRMYSEDVTPESTSNQALGKAVQTV